MPLTVLDALINYLSALDWPMENGIKGNGPPTSTLLQRDQLGSTA
jgi:hypothetical protein